MRTVAFTVGLLVLVGLPLRAPAQAQTDSTYTVESGDTLYSIAQDVGVSVRSLMRWNDLEAPDLQVGQTLRVRPPTADRPSASSDADTTAPPSDPAPPAPDTATASASPDTTGVGPPPYGRHPAASGDTFVDLALRLGTTADTLFALNDSTTAPLSAGRTLRLPRRFAPPTHLVESGQTLYSIAGRYGVSVRALKATNDLETDTLQPGRRLQIPRAGTEVPASWAPPDSTGRVAVYPSAFAGRLTASGTAYDPNEFVVSHPSLPFDSVVLLSTRDSTRHTFARVIDRGPVEEGVLLDVSAAVARTLGLQNAEAPSVALRVVWAARE